MFNTVERVRRMMGEKLREKKESNSFFIKKLLVEIAVPLTMEQKRTGSKLSITKRPISNRRAITQSIQIIGKVVSKKMKKKPANISYAILNSLMKTIKGWKKSKVKKESQELRRKLLYMREKKKPNIKFNKMKIY